MRKFQLFLLMFTLSILFVFVGCTTDVTTGGAKGKPQEECIPSVEICNNIDDDCNSLIDEGGVCNSPDGCIDSDMTPEYQNGKNPEEKGSLTLYSPEGKVVNSFADLCFEGGVRENFCCAQNKARCSVWIKCQNGCVDGKCIAVAQILLPPYLLQFFIQVILIINPE